MTRNRGDEWGRMSSVTEAGRDFVFEEGGDTQVRGVEIGAGGGGGWREWHLRVGAGVAEESSLAWRGAPVFGKENFG